MEKALQAAGRDQNEAKLIAVSKTVSAEDIHAALNAGQRYFGENRVQEAKQKWPNLQQAFPDIKLHLIGPLQSNKAEEAIRLFDVIQTIDRPKIATALAAALKKTGRMLEFFVQVNIGKEPQKAGVKPELADEFINFCKNNLGLNVIGVMCIPPQSEDPAEYFLALRDIADRNNLKELSMGMSGDYELAIKSGATLVRVGSAIFGHRPKL